MTRSSGSPALAMISKFCIHVPIEMLKGEAQITPENGLPFFWRFAASMRRSSSNVKSTRFKAVAWSNNSESERVLALSSWQENQCQVWT